MGNPAIRWVLSDSPFRCPARTATGATSEKPGRNDSACSMIPPVFCRQSLLPVLFACCLSGAAASAAVPSGATMVAEVSSAALAGGNAQLTMTALRWQAGRYLGDYRLKVSPYAFKNETGTLSIGVSDDSLRRLSEGKPVSFTGTVKTSGTDKTRPVSVKVTPTAPGLREGKLLISITTKNGALVFAPAYTLTGDGETASRVSDGSIGAAGPK